MSVCYLTYRWFISLTLLTLLAQSLGPRLIQSPRTCWYYLLYLAHWVRLLAVLHHTWEAALVTSRWRTELAGQVDASVREGYSSGPGPTLPWSHRILWTLANINTEVSGLCSLVYWPFIYTPEHDLGLENLSGHAIITAINIWDIFISARPWRCLHAYQAQLFCLAYSLSSLVTLEEEGRAVAQGSRDLPYSYSLLPSKPSHALITILGVSLLLPFIHLAFILLYKLRCCLVTLAGRGHTIHGKGRVHREQGIEMAEGTRGLLTA